MKRAALSALPLTFILLIVPFAARAATITWGGGGTDDNWSTCANWVGGVCPGSADTVVFNSTSVKNAIIDTSATNTVSVLDINTGYTGTVSLGENFTISGNGYALSQSAGTFDMSGYTLTFSNQNTYAKQTSGTVVGTNATTTFSNNGGIYTNHLSCTGTWPGVVDPGSGSTAFQLDSGCAATLAANISKGGSITLAGNATVPSGSTITMTGQNSTLSVTGSFAGLAGLATTTFSNNGGIYINYLSCTGTWPGVVDPGSGSTAFQLDSGCSATLAENIVKSGNITLAGNATALPGSTITLSGNNKTLSVTGSLTGLASLGTTTFSGTGGTSYSQYLACTGSFPGIVDPGTGADTFQLDSGCAAALGANVSKSGKLTIDGTLDLGGFNVSANGGIITASTSVLKLTGAQTTITTPTLDYGSTVEYTGSGSYTKLPAGGTYGNLIISGSGSFATSSSLTIYENFTQTAGTFTPSATTTFTGATSTTIITTAGSTFGNVEISKTATSTFLAGNGLSLANLLLTSGTLDASASGCSGISCGITLTGNWINNGGTFTPHTGTTTFDGTNQSITGSNSFYNLKKTVTSADTWAFPAGDTQTVGGTWTAQGAASNLLSLQSSSPGTQWKIDPTAANLSYVDISDADNTSGSTLSMTGTNSIDGGNNTGFSFNATPATPASLGPAADTSGSWTTTATPTLTFTTSDTDGDNMQYELQIADNSSFASPVVDYTSAFAAGGASSFTVGQAAGSGTYAAGSASQTLSDGSYYWRVKAGDTSYATSSYATANGGSIAFKVDATAPTPGTVTLSSITSSSITATLSGASDSGSGLAAAPYFFWESTLGTTTGATTSTSWTLSSLSPSTSYSFSVGVTDTAGNTATTTVVRGTTSTAPSSSSSSSAAKTASNGPVFTGPTSALPGYVKPRPQIIHPDGTITYLDGQPSGLSATQVSAVISLLSSFGADQSTIAAITTALGGEVLGTSSESTPATYGRDLTVGDTGPDVKALQAFLNMQGFTLAPNGPGAPGEETERFGALTRAALARYQQAHHITPAVGYFGVVTRGAIGAGQ